MKKKRGIVRHTRAELGELLARGDDRSDWARVDAMTEEELMRSISEDADWAEVPEDWYEKAQPSVSEAAKRQVRLRLDADVLAWFRAQGPGYHDRINAVLRRFMEARRARRA